MSMLKSQILGDFSGGLDLVSALGDVSPDATPNSLNFVASEFGGLDKVLGYSAFADLGAGVVAHDLYYYQKRDGSSKYLIVASSTKWHAIDSNGTVTDIRTGMTANTDTTFCVVDDTLYGVDANNVMHSWSGTGTTSAVSGTPPQGVILGVWQDIMWIAEASAGSLTMKVRWSAVADFTSWSSSNFVQLAGAGDHDRIVGGQVTGNGVATFCQSSTHLIYSASNGANRVVDPEFGATSRRSLTILQGEVYGVNRNGLFTTDGTFLKPISRLYQTMFINDSPGLTAAAGIAWKNHYLCSFQRAGVSHNDLTVEVIPILSKWIKHIGFGPPPAWPYEYPSNCWAHGALAGSDERLYFIDAVNTRYIRRAFNSGSFIGNDGTTTTDITAYYDTPPLAIDGEQVLKRLRRVRVTGRGAALTVGVRIEYSPTILSSHVLSFPAVAGSPWGTATFGSASWAGYVVSNGFATLSARGRRIGLRFSETSQATAPTRPDLNADPTGLLGGAGVYEAELYFNISSRRRN